MDITSANISTYQHPKAVAVYSREEELYPVEREIVLRYFPAPPARLLDLGCGAGRTSGALSRMGYRVTAIDLADALLRSARARGRGTAFVEMDARYLAFRNGSFDCAIFSFNGMDSIHPSSERLRVFREVARVLVRGGIFFYSGHNALGGFGRHGLSGFFGHWRKHFRLLAAQRRNRAIAENYWIDDDLCGQQLLYQGPPRAHLKILRKLGFRLRCVRGLKYHNDHDSLLWRGAGQEKGIVGEAVSLSRLTWSCHHIMYVVAV